MVITYIYLQVKNFELSIAAYFEDNKLCSLCFNSVLGIQVKESSDPKPSAGSRHLLHHAATVYASEKRTCASGLVAARLSI